MTPRANSILAALALSLVLQPGSSAWGASQHYLENFTTSLHKDAATTTAWWDTVSASVGLFPFEPEIVGTCDTPGIAGGVVVEGNQAYVADDIHGLQVIDISDPGQPLLVGSCDTPGSAVDVFVAGHHAYVADSAFGLQVIDISDPAHPTRVGSCDTDGFALDVTGAGDYVYIADGDGGLQVVDVRDPAHPVLSGVASTPGFARGVALAGPFAIVAVAPSGLVAIDIRSPTDPTLVGSCATTGSAQDIEVSGDFAFLAAYSSFEVVDISDVSQPVVVAAVATPGDACDVSVSGDRAVVADLAAGLQIFDVSNPADPVLKAACDTPGLAMGVTIAGTRALVADQAAGIQVVSIAMPIDPTTVGICNLAYRSNDVSVAGKHAYVANENGLVVIDVTDPLNPVLAGSCATNGLATGVAVAGDRAYVTNPWLSLQVIDVSDPSQPVRIDSFVTTGTASGVAISGNHAFVADGTAGLQVFDIFDPDGLQLVGTCDTPGTAVAVTVSGTFAYVADGAAGVQVIDISHATQPDLVGTWVAPGAPGFAAAIAVSGEHAYVANGDRGLSVLDISDATLPTDVGANVQLARADGIALAGDLAYVACSGGLGVVDISQFWSPVFLGTFGARSDAFSVELVGDHAFLTGRTSALEILRVAQGDHDTARNIAGSVSVATTTAPIFKARLATTQTSSVTWTLSADAGEHWTEITPGDWYSFEVPGPSLRWRSRHSWAAPGVNPAVHRLEIDWLREAAAIDAIVDVPRDQGGWVRAQLTRSCRDFADEEALPVVSYGIWRRVDDIELASAIESQASAMTVRREPGPTPELAGVPVVTVDGRRFTVADLGASATSFPPGPWEWVATIPATQQDRYLAVVPTVADSTAADGRDAVYVVTTHTVAPSVWYVSEPAGGHSTDNLPPAAPTGLSAAARYLPEGLALSWLRNVENDLAHYSVHRGTTADFVPEAGNRIATPTAAAYFDGAWRPDGGYCYKISAIDVHANESPFASVDAYDVTGVNLPGVEAARLHLFPVRPNPFNPRTTLRFDLPEPGFARLCVYDVAGHFVRTLVAGNLPAGSHEAAWDGRDAAGREVGSGSYLARLEFAGTNVTVGMGLIR